MLVLTRKTQQQIQIGDNITITVLQVKGQSIRLGIEAPRDVRVVRAELPRFESEPVVAEFEVALTADEGSEAATVSGTSASRGGARNSQAGVESFSSPRPQLDKSQEGRGDHQRRRVVEAVSGGSSVRPPQRLGPSSLKALVAARRGVVG